MTDVPVPSELATEAYAIMDQSLPPLPDEVIADIKWLVDEYGPDGVEDAMAHASEATHLAIEQRMLIATGLFLAFLDDTDIIPPTPEWAELLATYRRVKRDGEHPVMVKDRR